MPEAHTTSLPDHDRRFTGKDVLVSVLNYNLVEETISTLRSLFDQDCPRCDFELVDNGSSRDCLPEISATFPDLATTRFAVNLGYAAGMNAILERGFAAGYRYVLLCNNDIALPRGAVEHLIETADANPDAGVVGGVECAGHTGEARNFGGAAIDFARGRFPVLTQPRSAILPTEPVAYSQGCIVLWTRGLFDSGVRYDERLFMYYEEPDIGLQMGRMGLRAYVDKRVRVLHFNEERRLSPRVAYYLQRNRIYLVRKHASASQKCLFILRLGAVDIPKCLAKLLIRRSPNDIAFARGICDALRNRYGRVL